MTAIYRIAPVFLIYTGALVLVLLFFNQNWIVIPFVYALSFILGALLMLINEENLVPDLMKNEIEHYFKSIVNHANQDEDRPEESLTLNLITAPVDFLQIQYDYYIKKSVLSQRLSSMYLIALLSGIVIDISLNALSPQDITRTILLIGSVAFFSTLYFTISILKHAEYNAGCAIYRFAILSLNMIQRNYPEKSMVTKGELWSLLGKTFEHMRNKKPEYYPNGEIKISAINSADAMRNVKLLQLYGFLHN